MSNSLSQHHQDEISKYLKFFRGKLNLHLQSVEVDFDDTKSDRLSSEDMYNQSEITEVLDSLAKAVKSNVRAEFQETINMTALLLKQLFQEADAKNVSLEMDTSIIEDKALLDKVERLAVTEWTNSPLSEQKTYKNKISDKKEEDLKQNNDKIKKMEKEMNDLQQKIEKLTKESQQHISQSKQFQQMKKMVSEKNEKIKELRDRLQRYEPDNDVKLDD